MKKLTDFSLKVVGNIKRIPKGYVATYGQIAKLSGKPLAARGVSWILYSCSRKYKLPWHRVLGSQGKISFPRDTRNYHQQKRRLELEGVEFMEGDKISLPKFQWKKKK